MVTVLQAYALIATGVRIICTNQASRLSDVRPLTDASRSQADLRCPSQVGGGARSTVVSTQGAASVRDNIVTVFGARTAEGLQVLSAPAGAGARFEG